MKSSRRNTMTVITTLFVSLVIAYLSFSPAGSGYLFAKLTAGFLVFIALLMVILTFIPKKSIVVTDDEPIPWGIILPTLLILIGFLLVVDWLGFFATSFIAFYSIVLIYTPGILNRRQYYKSAAISATFIAVLYLIFVMLLNVQIPHGVLI